MRLKKTNTLLSLLLIIATMFSIVSCSGVNTDKAVSLDELNDSPENVCRGYFEAIYNHDEEMFNQCMYEGVFTEEDSVYESYQGLVDPEMEFVGTKHISTRQCNIDNGYDFDVMKDNISVFNEIDASRVEDIQLVNIKVFFKLGDEYKSVELFSAVYRVESNWYFFSIIDRTQR